MHDRNLTSVPISYTTLAPYGVDDVTGTASFDPAGLLVAGTNVLAAEVHQVSGSSSDLHFELELRAIREEEGQGEPGAAVWRQYYYAAGVRVALREGQGSGTAGLRFLLGDHLGSTHVTTDASGTKLAELRYKPWGDVRYAEGSTPTSFRFTGQREEADLGIYYYGARWYDPALGHFLQAYSIVPGPGIPLAWNRYAYTLYNPINYTDPTGHWFDREDDNIGHNQEDHLLEQYVTGYINPGTYYDQAVSDGYFSLPDEANIPDQANLGPEWRQATIAGYDSARRALFLQSGFQFITGSGQITDEALLALIIASEFGLLRDINDGNYLNVYLESMEALSNQYYSSLFCSGSCSTEQQLSLLLNIEAIRNPRFIDSPINNGAWLKYWNDATRVQMGYSYGSDTSWMWGNANDDDLPKYAITAQAEYSAYPGFKYSIVYSGLR